MRRRRHPRGLLRYIGWVVPPPAVNHYGHPYSATIRSTVEAGYASAEALKGYERAIDKAFDLKDGGVLDR